MWTDAFAQTAGPAGAAPANPMIGTMLNALPIIAMLAISTS
jgi:hypothetical protein